MYFLVDSRCQWQRVTSFFFFLLEKYSLVVVTVWDKWAMMMQPLPPSVKQKRENSDFFFAVLEKKKKGKRNIWRVDEEKTITFYSNNAITDKVPKDIAMSYIYWNHCHHGIRFFVCKQWHTYYPSLKHRCFLIQSCIFYGKKDFNTLDFWRKKELVQNKTICHDNMTTEKWIEYKH